MTQTYNIKRVAEGRQPYRRNGYDGPENTAYRWWVIDPAGKVVANAGKLGEAKSIIREHESMGGFGGFVGKIIRD